MAKKAKGFQLEEIEEKGASYEMGEEKSEQKEEEAILLDIMGDEGVPLSPAEAAKKVGGKKDKIRFMEAYKKLHKAFRIRRKVPVKEKAVFYELLSTMLGAGISVIAAIRVFAGQTGHKYFKKITEALSYQLEKGQSLSDAMGEYPKIFSESELGMIQSAEATGRLTDVMKRLSVDLEEALALRRKIVSAMIYPVIVVLVVIGVVYAMLRGVIPQISALFVESGLELPAITQFVIDASEFVVNNGFLVLAVTFGAIATIYLFTRARVGKKIIHRLALKLPLLKDFQKAINQAQFTRSISNLMNAGIGIVEACRITAKAVNNLVYKDKINLIAKDVSQGIPLAESMQDSPYFSNLVVSMISVGERTAQIDELSRKTADYYEEKVSNMAENFSKIIQPFVILVVGGIVMVIVLAIMLPMTELLSGIDAL